MATREVLSRKLVIADREYFPDGFRTYNHWCPACQRPHSYAVETPFRNGAKWMYDGNAEAPSFTPSMNISWGPMSDGSTRRCHYFVTAGKIAYCEDSTHSMAGQTVDLPDLPERYLSVEA